MARVNTIDDVVNSVINNYQTLLENAVVHVAEQAKKDIKDKAVNVLYKYYYGGYKPESYERSFALEHSIMPFSQISSVGSGKSTKLQCVVGVEYNPWLLEEYVGEANGFAYDASKKYGQVDGDWVIQNFWEGKHPYTDGSTDPDSASKSFDYHYSKTTQDEGMRKTDETGVSLLRYAHTTFPKAVMNYMLVEGSKIF